MPLPTVTQNRLDNVVICLTMTTNSLQIIADSMKTPFLGAIINTTQAVLKNIQLLEQIHKLLDAIMILHIKSDAGGEMPVKVLDHVGKFTEYCPCPLEIHYTLTTEIRILHKIYTFVEAQQKGNRVKSFFRQGEISTLLKDCQAGLQQSFEFFQIEGTRALLDIAGMKKDAEKRHQEVLDMIEKLSEATASETASTISGHYSEPSNSSNSISILPSEPKIFHGRESELSDILHLFNTGIPRIAILGAGGMGKTSLARAVLHHPDIMARYVQNRFFVACNSATTGIELANLIGSHLGLKPSKNLTQAVLQYFANNPPSLLILDELETLWEPASSRANIEELLSLLTAVEDLALMANSGHSLEEVDQILSLADNMPLAISLLAHLADTEGCSNVLSRWDKEKTSVISEGFDKRSNLDICKTALKSTSLVYSDEHKRLKVLMPIREYLQQHQPPGDHLIQNLFKYFQEMLKFYIDYVGTQSSSSTIPRIKSNLTNIQNVLQWGLKQKQPTLLNSIYCSISSWQYYPISDPEALASQVLELFKDFDDPDLKCRFYLNMTTYYYNVKNDCVGAVNMCKRLISVATKTGNTRRHGHGLRKLAWINMRLGIYSVAQMDACESQKLSRVSGDLYGEAEAVHTEAFCWKELGHYKQSLSLSIRAQSLLSFCGMSDSDVNLGIMNTQAEGHKCKSEYSEAWIIQTKILQSSTSRNAYWHAVALLNLAEIAVSIGVQKQDGKGSTNSKETVQKCLELATEHNEIKLFCFERLGNASFWDADEMTPGWTTIFLIHSLKLKAKLQVYKALQFLGQIFLTHKDENTAISLFTVALEGFTYMDVHCSRAECMVRLGDISNRCGDPLKAVEFWNTARPLFERSSQAKEVQCVDERLSHVGSNVLDHHRENIIHLVRLDVPSGNLSHIKDEEQVEFIGEPLNQLTI
ncbi:hypothetical protein B0H14DRAFT_3678208 [Mycena olivaceomarginata]|nr:hypothetical protein B0H14DRAFT_3678208 [Mycena olivaceomarginata]